MKFVERLRSTPTKEMKLQAMQEIAKQFSIVWDSKALEQKLFQPPPPVNPPVKVSSSVCSVKTSLFIYKFKVFESYDV